MEKKPHDAGGEERSDVTEDARDDRSEKRLLKPRQQSEWGPMERGIQPSESGCGKFSARHVFIEGK